MLETYQSIANRLYRWRHGIWMLCFGAFVAFWTLLLAPGNSGTVWLLPLVVVFGWLLSLSGVIGAFHRGIPKPTAEMNLFRRVKLTIKLTYSWFLALLLSVSTLALLFLAFRAITLLIG